MVFGGPYAEVDNMTLNEAKTLYQKYNCSLFSIFRECEPRDYEYISSLPPKTLYKWSKEKLMELYGQLKEEGSWEKLYKIVVVFKSAKNRKNLLIVLDALHLVNYSEPNINAIVAGIVTGETIFPFKDGLIYIAYDMGEKKIANELLQFAYKLVSVQTSDSDIKRSFEWTLERCANLETLLNK